MDDAKEYQEHGMWREQPSLAGLEAERDALKAKVAELEEALLGLLKWREEPEVGEAFDLLRERGKEIEPARNANLGMRWCDAIKALGRS